MKVINFFLKKLNIHVFIISYLAYLILYLFKVDVSYGSVAFAIVHTVVIGVAFYTIFRLIFPLDKTNNKSKKSVDSTKKNIGETTKKNSTIDSDNNANLTVDTSENFYKVRQGPRYYFKEFSDRYELYLKTSSGFKHVKTDYKKDV